VCDPLNLVNQRFRRISANQPDQLSKRFQNGPASWLLGHYFWQLTCDRLG
jgi:hypothetical protein